MCGGLLSEPSIQPTSGGGFVIGRTGPQGGRRLETAGQRNRRAAVVRSPASSTGGGTPPEPTRAPMKPPTSPQTTDLAEALAELASLMLSTAGVDELLEQLAKLAAGRVAPAAACGITLRQDHQPASVASSAPIAAYVDEIQYERDDGPCLQSMRTGDTVLVVDLADERRWGSYPGDALVHGVRASLSLPLRVDGELRGAINLYALQPDAFGPDDLDRAELCAAQASTALTVAVRHAQQVQLTEQLREALVQRAVIDQAIGILMAEQGCDPDTAFSILRRASQHQNRKLREVAAEIVESVAGRATGPTPFSDPA